MPATRSPQNISSVNTQCDHLNKLLGADAELRCSRLHAAEFPVKVGVMRKWMGKIFDMHWRRNKKGTANQIHERDDAVQQRHKYIYDNKDREHQQLVWHHVPLAELARSSSPLYKLALMSQRVDAETDLIDKKYGDRVQAELMHNVHVYTRTGVAGKERGSTVVCIDGDLEEMVQVEITDQRMVEFHVDFLRVEERLRLYPCWGGDMSRRVDKSKVSSLHLFQLPLSLPFILSQSYLPIEWEGEKELEDDLRKKASYFA